MEPEPGRRRSRAWTKDPKRTGSFLFIGLLVAFAVALVLSPQASTQPDGLEKVAIDHGFKGAEKAHAFDGTPVAGYALGGIENDRLATGLAGVIGVALTFALGAGLVLLARRRVNADAAAPPGADPGLG